MTDIDLGALVGAELKFAFIKKIHGLDMRSVGIGTQHSGNMDSDGLEHYFVMVNPEYGDNHVVALLTATKDDTNVNLNVETLYWKYANENSPRYSVSDVLMTSVDYAALSTRTNGAFTKQEGQNLPCNKFLEDNLINAYKKTNGNPELFAQDYIDALLQVN